MAYQRPSVVAHQQQTYQRTYSNLNNIGINNSSNYHLNELMESDEEEEEDANLVKEKYTSDYHQASHVSNSHKSLIIMNAIDITNWSPILQFIILVFGLILFMCLYGYYQELVIYGWFDRKLSMFSTFLHFLGCSLFAQLHRNMTKSNTNNSIHENANVPHSASTIPSFLRPLYDRFPEAFQYFRCPHLSMGTASPSVALGYYILLVLMKTMAQGLSNLSMTQISYPAKVLFKSANPIVTIFLGLVWFRKHYPIRDYVVVLMLVIGLYIFMMGDTWYTATDTGTITDTPATTNATTLGIFYVILSMFGSAGVPMIQEYCITMYHASVDDLVYHIYLGSTIVSFALAVGSNELLVGLLFLWQNSSWSIWLIFLCFCTFGFVGSNFSTLITQQHGALVNGILSTFRKAVTIALSFFLFPERNHINSVKVVGTLIFFAGVVVRILYKSSPAATPALPVGKRRKDKDLTVTPPQEAYDVENAKPVESALATAPVAKRSSPRKRITSSFSPKISTTLLIPDLYDIEAVADTTSDQRENQPTSGQEEEEEEAPNYPFPADTSKPNDANLQPSPRTTSTASSSNNSSNSLGNMKVHKTMII